MTNLTREDLYSLEEYANIRGNFRQKVIDHKKNRRVQIGNHAALYFEDSLTMQYQIQEMLRIEKIFESAGIQEELDVYNPLIPDGNNWKATFMMEYSNIDERKKALANLVGIENQLYVQVGDMEKVYAIANEDLERSTDEKTSAVHFVRFELSDEMVAQAKAGAPVKAGIDHQNYNEMALIEENVRQSLIGDLN